MGFAIEDMCFLVFGVCPTCKRSLGHEAFRMYDQDLGLGAPKYSRNILMDHVELCTATKSFARSVQQLRELSDLRTAAALLQALPCAYWGMGEGSTGTVLEINHVGPGHDCG